MSDCTLDCWAMPDCTVCGQRKQPHGRSVPAAAAGGYCGYGCEGYYLPPKAGHYWPEEEPEKRAAHMERRRTTVS